MMTLDHARRLLDVDAGCTADDARQNYRDLVRVWHPDRFETDARLRAKAEQRLAQITEAYRVFEAGRISGGGLRGETRRPPREVRVQPPVAAVPPVRRAWMGHLAVALVVIAAMAMLAIPRRNALVVFAPAFVETPAVPVAAETPVAPVRKPAVVRASPARSFIARETDAVLSRR